MKERGNKRKSRYPMDEVSIWFRPDQLECSSMRSESLDRVRNPGIITDLLGWSNQL
jgi:hypothetical protein